MKLLVAIDSVDHKRIADRALRWCGRLGYEVRLFVPKGKRSKFTLAVDDANYNWYLALDVDATVVSRTDALSYAKQNGFELLVQVPEGLHSWRRGTNPERAIMRDNDVKLAFETIAEHRREFEANPRKTITRFSNGVIMRRV